MLLERIIKKILLPLLFIAVLGYAIFRLYPFILGPKIILTSPKNGEVVASSTFLVTGRVQHASNFKILGRNVKLSESGGFSERIVYIAPYTVLTMIASDPWGRETTEEVFVTGK